MTHGLIDGRLLELLSVPLNRLAEMPVTGAQLSEHISDNTNPHGELLYQKELMIGNAVRISAVPGALEIKNLNNSDYLSINLKNINLINGEINQVNLTELNIEDAFINLNRNAAGSPVADSGVRVIRGDNPSLALYWKESARRWRVQQENLLGDYAEFDLAHLGDVYTKIESDNRFVNVTGDQMSGPLLILDNTNAAIKLQSPNESTAIGLTIANGGKESEIYAIDGVLNISPFSSSNIYKPVHMRSAASNLSFVVSDTAAPVISTDKAFVDFTNKIHAAGFDAKNNRVTNISDPINNLDAVNLGFADTRYVNATGDVMTGNLTVNADIISSNDYLRLNNSQPDSNGGIIIANSVSNAIAYFNNADKFWYIGTEASSSRIVTQESLNNPENTQTIRNIIGDMISGNTELGIAVTYTGTKLNFDVNDPTLSISGDASGSAQMVNLGNTNIIVTVHDDSHNHSNLTGTTQSLFKIKSASDGAAVKASANALQVRNLADNDYADLHVKSLYVHGPVTEVAAETLTIADNIITLNSNITSGSPFENAGIEVRRGNLNNAQVIFNESIDKWTVGVVGDMYEIARFDSQLTNTILDTTGGMVSGNTENGLSVTYSGGKLHFDVNDPVITLTGNVTGSGTLVNLGNLSIATTVHDSAKVAGLSVHTGRNNEVNKIVRTDGSGYIQAGWINTTSGSAGTNTMDRVYASYDGYVRYYTPLNFANQILALGSVKNSHTHDTAQITSGTLPVSRGGTGLSSYTTGYFLRASSGSTLAQRSPAQVLADIGAAPAVHSHNVVNNLTMQRYESTFAGVGSNRYISISGFNSTNYSVTITPTSNPGGNLGEVYVLKYAGYFRVYNSGTSTASFNAIVIGSPA